MATIEIRQLQEDNALWQKNTSLNTLAAIHDLLETNAYLNAEVERLNGMPLLDFTGVDIEEYLRKNRIRLKEQGFDVEER